MKEDNPSATAFLIARSTWFLSRDPGLGWLVPARSAEISRWFIQSRRRLSRAMDVLTNWRPVAGALERISIPGIRLHYALRKRYLEEVARAALEGGARQAVIMGAGFDTLALRLHEDYPGVEFFEVDHPATQRVKRLAAEGNGHVGRNLHFVALDLARGSLEESLLARPGYSEGADTLFIAEGLLMYLALAEVDLILQFVSRRSGSGSRLAFTFMEEQAGGRIGFRNSGRVVDAWLRLRGESFRWGIGRERVPEFLASRGFEAAAVVTAENLWDMYLTHADAKRVRLAEGECICVAAPGGGGFR